MARRSLNRDLLEARMAGKDVDTIQKMMEVSPHRRHRKIATMAKIHDMGTMAKKMQAIVDSVKEETTN